MRGKSQRRDWNGAIAQLGERLDGIQEVVGSIPTGSTTLRRFAATTNQPDVCAAPVAKKATAGRFFLQPPAWRAVALGFIARDSRKA
jgi:hypothetical protein